MKELKLTHFSKEKDLKLEVREYPNSKDHVFKPNGLWLSANGGWEDWAGSEMPDMVDRCCYEIELAKNVNLLVIDSKEKFNKVFKELTDYNMEDGSFELIKEGKLKVDIKKDVEKFGRDFMAKYEAMLIFHNKIQKKYDGVFMDWDKVWKHRLDFSDFGSYIYPWDCASVVLWNIDKIKSVELSKK